MLAVGLSTALRSLVPVQLLNLNAGSAPLMDVRVVAFMLVVTLPDRHCSWAWCRHCNCRGQIRIVC